MNKIPKGARMNALARKQKILDAAIELAITYGYKNITRRAVALQSGSAEGLISRYFETIANLRREVLKEAVKMEIMPILIENLGAREFDKIQLSPELKNKVINYLTN